jgi:prepilin-type N-terminal cleavage/methylation domain-containing protein
MFKGYKNNFRKAFSLVEISVVIVIIGILIAGISSGIDLYGDFIVSKAKNLTTNSRVGRISDLNLWLETTTDKSFLTAEKFNNAPISNWNAINLTSSTIISATQANSNYKPKYIVNGFNGLPVIRFEGKDTDNPQYSDYMNLPNEIVPYGDSDYSVFIVAKKTLNNSARNIVLSGGSIVDGSTRSMNAFGFMDNNAMNYWYPSSSILNSPTNSINSNNFYITEFFYDKNVTLNRFIYINGSKVAEANLGSRISTKNNNFIGRRSDSTVNYFDGDLAELIVYNRAISSSERKSVEEYLSRKWNIKIAN